MSGFLPDLRARTITALRDNSVDVLILGGGINGAGVLRDLCLRRASAGLSLSIALAEQNHFASATSGKTSQLIHGGLRYLKYLKFALVKESLRERAVLRRIAPHLVEPIAFLLPIYSRLDKMKFLLGLTLYDQLAGDQNISKHREVSKTELRQLEPNLDTTEVVGGALFYDCTVHAARFVLENLFDAAAHGGYLANYLRATPVERQPDGSWLVEYHDRLADEKFQGYARKIINATGAWSQPGDRKPRLVRGSHLIFPRLTSEDHAIAYFDENGRIVFLIPWGSERQLTLVGTTDVDHNGDPDHARISEDEIRYLVKIVQKLYPNAPSHAPVAAYSALRPLVDNEAHNPTDASREHKIWNTPDGILHILGGKYTTYRQMSEEACNLYFKETSTFLSIPCKTASEPLNGNSDKALARLRSEAAALAQRHLLAKVEVDRLIRDYGVHTRDLLAFLPSEDYGPISRVLCARMDYAVQHEMALRLSDFLYVSTHLGFERTWDAQSLEVYAQRMGSLLNWNSARQAREIMQALEVSRCPGTAP
ncbi:MAG: glycerol-3-phosphate dehydrogenase/oxidase [Bryobacteraceae bacterium]|nr:glycerol-3-phosphate dehydrogenase/oxidase [Bryobacteraceae bacterium]MDW8379974.1 glycerol-3-phosphate dehydrogenase/oxidase [Bryobacterales bacterium]